MSLLSGKGGGTTQASTGTSVSATGGRRETQSSRLGALPPVDFFAVTPVLAMDVVNVGVGNGEGQGDKAGVWGKDGHRTDDQN